MVYILEETKVKLVKEIAYGDGDLRVPRLRSGWRGGAGDDMMAVGMIWWQGEKEGNKKQR